MTRQMRPLMSPAKCQPLPDPFSQCLASAGQASSSCSRTNGCESSPVCQEWKSCQWPSQCPSLLPQFLSGSTSKRSLNLLIVVLPSCPVVSTLISPQNYFTHYTSVTVIYTLVESMPGAARRSHIFTLISHCKQSALSSFFLIPLLLA